MDMFNNRECHAGIWHLGVINIILIFSVFSLFSTREIRLKSGKAYGNFHTHVCCNTSVA